MEKYLSLAILLFTSIATQAQSQFVLSGTITGAPANTYVKIRYVDDSDKNITDSVLISNGAFQLKGSISEPTVANLSISKKNSFVYLEPPQIVVKANVELTDVKVTGSKTHDENLEFQAISNALDTEFKPVSDKIRAAQVKLRTAKQNNLPQATIDSLNDLLLVLGKERATFAEKYEQLVRNFALTHPASVISANQMFVYVSSWSLDDVKKIFAGFSASVQNSRDGKAIKKAITDRELQQAGLSKDFTAMALDGKPFTLSSLKGKYVLLDFWGSWCVPCRAEMPHGKELFAKYHNSGLEIVAVAVEHDDNKESSWRRAVKQDGTGIWYNVLQKEDKNGKPGNITGLYNVAVFPTKILIDKAGNIIGRYDGGGSEELDKKLAELFKVGRD